MGQTLDPNASTKAWALWLGATVTTFAALEAHAVSTRKVPTLSHCLRAWLGVEPVKPWRIAASLAFCGLWAWLCGHVALGWPPNLKGDRRAPKALERSDPHVFDDSIEYERRR